MVTSYTLLAAYAVLSCRQGVVDYPCLGNTFVGGPPVFGANRNSDLRTAAPHSNLVLDRRNCGYDLQLG